MNILLTLAFDGTAYHGWQVQANAPTVCAALQDGMQALLGVRSPVKGCSRTDAGVHARAFCASFHTETPLPFDKWPLALNAHLPADIRVRRAQPVPDEFHARYSATGKQYTYHILNAATDDPLARGLYHRVAAPIDADAMHEAGQALLGRHNFAAFCAAGSSTGGRPAAGDATNGADALPSAASRQPGAARRVESGGHTADDLNTAQDAATVRTVTALHVVREGDWVVLTVAADGFLYNMVRIIAGTLLRVGTGRESSSFPARALQSGLRRQAGETLPARGLFLDRVFYPPELLPD